MRTIALIGLSGVGKSTALNELAQEITFLHLQASQLLKDGFARQKLATPSSEELRLGDVANNQKVLIESFRLATADTRDLVILDGHLLIDGRDSVTEIPATVFADIGISGIIYLCGAPEVIASRRDQDIGRVRPRRTPDELAEHQAHEIRLATSTCIELGIPLLICSSEDRSIFSAFIKAKK